MWDLLGSCLWETFGVEVLLLWNALLGLRRTLGVETRRWWGLDVDDLGLAWLALRLVVLWLSAGTVSILDCLGKRGKRSYGGVWATTCC